MHADNLTEQQKAAIAKVKVWFNQPHNQIFRLYGYAGTGKTSILPLLISELGLGMHQTEICAFTGRAALVLRNKGLAASTIHSLIYTVVSDVASTITQLEAVCIMLTASVKILREESGNEQKIQDIFADIKANETKIEALKTSSGKSRMFPEFILDPFSSVKAASLVIIDEASMVDGVLAKDLESFGVKILYVGDPFQLPPVSRSKQFDSPMYTFRGDLIPPDIELTEIHRQAQDNPIIKLASMARAMQPIRAGSYGGKVLKTSLAKLSDEVFLRADQVICGKNLTRSNMNCFIREAKGRKSKYPEAGEKLIILKNNNQLGIFNGQIMTAREKAYKFAAGNSVFQLDLHNPDTDGSLINKTILAEYYTSATPDFSAYSGHALANHIHSDYGYVITVHKCQGMGFDNVILLEEPIGRTTEERYRWLYTGITRSSDKLIIAT